MNPYQQLVSRLVEKHDRLWTAQELITQPDPLWLIDDLLIENTFGVLVGQPGIGKTFLALDWALAIATGERALGTLTVQQGPVLYLVAEGARGMGSRIRAWSHKKGIEVPDTIRFLPHAMNLNHLDDQDQLLSLASVSYSTSPKLVVIDTMARCLDGDENSAEAVGAFVEGAARVQRELSCAILVVHHPNAMGSRERGSTALRGACDMLGMVQASGEDAALYCHKQKDAVGWEPIKFRLATELDSCVVMPAIPRWMSSNGKRINITGVA